MRTAAYRPALHRPTRSASPLVPMPASSGCPVPGSYCGGSWQQTSNFCLLRAREILARNVRRPPAPFVCGVELLGEGSLMKKFVGVTLAAIFLGSAMAQTGKSARPPSSEAHGQAALQSFIAPPDDTESALPRPNRARGVS